MKGNTPEFIIECNENLKFIQLIIGNKIFLY